MTIESFSIDSTIQKFSNNTPLYELLHVYSHGKCHIHPAFAPITMRDEILSNVDWDIDCYLGNPSFTVICPEKVTQYERFGNDDGFEPLVIERHFAQRRERLLEISEEFRLLFSLYDDKKNHQFVHYTDDGSAEAVIKYDSDNVYIRMLELQRFMKLKNMLLVLFYGRHITSPLTLEQLGVKPFRSELIMSGDHAYQYLYVEDTVLLLSNERSVSGIRGKRIFKPTIKAKIESPYDEPPERNYATFIIGISDNGRPVEYTCDSSKLANYFGSNPDAPNYMTPVFFRPQVLDKYYHEPSKYSVEDGCVRCHGCWLLRMDNHADEHVVVYLGDLSHLPDPEALHWKSHNIPPQKNGVSETAWKRDFLAESAESPSPAHQVHINYQLLADICKSKLGWHILRPLNDEDEHYLKQIRIPSSDEQKIFDDIVLAMAKVFIDALNEKTFKEVLTKNGVEVPDKGIGRFEAILNMVNCPNTSEHIKFLRELQALRSSGAAHLKGKNYEKITTALGADDTSLKSIARQQIVNANELLKDLIELVESSSIGLQT